MIFRSKIDTFYMIFISIASLVMGAVTILPPLFDENASIGILIFMSSMFLIIIALMVWGTFFIKYVFYEDYLLVKGGLMRSKIPYKSITKIIPTDNVFSGYRILSSKNALELFYTKGVHVNSVKISPRNQKDFIIELKKRCSTVEINESIYPYNDTIHNSSI